MFEQHLSSQLEQIVEAGTYKTEHAIASPQGGRVGVAGDSPKINLCANNYLGLANHPALVEAAKRALDERGFGMASVRFICGTQDLHKQLEARVAAYLGTEDAILFASCFDANAAVFEPLLNEHDAIVSDALNHASIIDGIRLCKARRFRYAHSDMTDLEAKLRAADSDGARHIMIATDGVFSMDGDVARLAEIRALADKFGAQVMVDDCHATGFVGPKGAGTPAAAGVKADILTGTFGKALGGGLGGYIAGSAKVVELLRQRARPYLFSNSLPPMIVAATLAALDIVEGDEGLRTRLWENAAFWRSRLSGLGFELLPGEHPIIPIMIRDERRTQAFAEALWEEGVFVTAFSYPVVPKGTARIRTQMSAALSLDDLETAAQAFERAGRKLELIP